jgi:hypothetical protein
VNSHFSSYIALFRSIVGLRTTVDKESTRIMWDSTCRSFERQICAELTHLPRGWADIVSPNKTYKPRCLENKLSVCSSV